MRRSLYSGRVWHLSASQSCMAFCSLFSKFDSFDMIFSSFFLRLLAVLTLMLCFLSSSCRSTCRMCGSISCTVTHNVSSLSVKAENSCVMLQQCTGISINTDARWGRRRGPAFCAAPAPSPERGRRRAPTAAPGPSPRPTRPLARRASTGRGARQSRPPAYCASPDGTQRRCALPATPRAFLAPTELRPARAAPGLWTLACGVAQGCTRLQALPPA